MNVLSSLYGEAVGLLHELTGPNGIRASLSPRANYMAVFARDAVMAGTAGLLIEDRVITQGLVRTLEHLREMQGSEGQIASNYEVHPDQPRRVSFGTLAPRIDATTWYLIGIALGARAAALDPAEFRDSVRSVVRLLDALEYNGRHLLYVPPGGNWADEYVYEGYILYDQVLRAWALRLLGATYDETAWLEKAAQIERAIESCYWPADHRGHPIASFSPTVSRDIFDLAACSLLAVSGIAPRFGGRALSWIAEQFLVHAKLPPAFYPVIDEAHPDWEALRRYHLHGFRNWPHEYHNGGVWPIWLGWLALALAQAGRGADLAQLRQVAQERLGSLTDFAFDEYLHGETNTPGGTPQMAYTATGIVFLNVAGSDSAAYTRLFSQ